MCQLVIVDNLTYCSWEDERMRYNFSKRLSTFMERPGLMFIDLCVQLDEYLSTILDIVENPTNIGEPHGCALCKFLSNQNLFTPINFETTICSVNTYDLLSDLYNQCVTYAEENDLTVETAILQLAISEDNIFLPNAFVKMMNFCSKVGIPPNIDCSSLDYEEDLDEEYEEDDYEEVM